MPRALSFEELEMLASFLFDRDPGSMRSDWAFKDSFKKWNKEIGRKDDFQDEYIDYLYSIFLACNNARIRFYNPDPKAKEWDEIAFMFWLAYVDEVLKDNPNEYVDPAAWESFKNVVNIFSTPDKAKEFLRRYISSQEKTLRIERLLEWGLEGAVRITQYMSLIRHISSDIDLITSDKYRNKFRTVTIYYDEIMRLKSNDSLLDTFAENAYSDLVDASKTKEKKSTKQFTEDQKEKFKQKFKDDYKANLKIKLQNLFDGKLSTKESLETCIEIAKLIARAHSKKLSKDQSEMLFNMGVGPTGFSQLGSLDKKESDSMPDAVVQLDGYYICKMSPQDIRGPFLGLATGCCQHLEGVGATAAIYGYTQENSCFYVMFKGKAPSKRPIDTTQLTDQIVAQSWAWKTEDAPGIIVFDSIEASGLVVGSESSKAKEQQIRVGFYELAKAIVTDSNNHIQQVRSGNGGTVVSPHIPIVTSLKINKASTKSDAGDDLPFYPNDTESETKIPNMVPIPIIDGKEEVYSDAEYQGTLYDIRLEKLIELNVKHGIDILSFISSMSLDAKSFFETCLKNGCNIPDAIKKIPNITKVKLDFLLHLIEPNTDVKSLLVYLLSNTELILEISPPEKRSKINDIVKLCIAAGADVNAVDKYGNSTLLLLIRNGNNELADFMLDLLRSGAKVDAVMLDIARDTLEQRSNEREYLIYEGLLPDGLPLVKYDEWTDRLKEIIKEMEKILDPKLKLSSRP